MVNKLFHSKLLRKVYPDAIWDLDDGSQTVYLTFDDGPHPDITPWVMRQLEDHGAKATFFCIGDNIRKFPETYQSILAAGHHTGNHTMHHLNGWKNDSETYQKDIQQCAELVSGNLFRPPYGRMRKKQAQVLLKDGYRTVMWSLLSRDYDRQYPPDQSLSFLKSATKRGSIVVFHDSEKAEPNLKRVLPAYLDFLVNNGFELKAIPL